MTMYGKNNFHAVRLAVSRNAKISGVGKNLPTVLGHFLNKFRQIWGMQRTRGVLYIDEYLSYG